MDCTFHMSATCTCFPAANLFRQKVIESLILLNPVLISQGTRFGHNLWFKVTYLPQLTLK